jgi:hypothetical protein
MGWFDIVYTLPPTPIHEQDLSVRKEALDTAVGLPCKPNEKPPIGVENGNGVFAGGGVSRFDVAPPIPEISHEVGVHTLGRLNGVTVGVGICTIGGIEGGGKGFRGERGLANTDNTTIRTMKTIIRITRVNKLKMEFRVGVRFESKEEFIGQLP